MSAYFYPQPHYSPREKYLEALAQAESAKAEYEASIIREAEIARRQRARDAAILQQRRREVARRQAMAELDYGFEPYGVRQYALDQYNVDPYQYARAQAIERERQQARLIVEERARLRAEAEADLRSRQHRAHQEAQAQPARQSTPEPTFEQLLTHILGGNITPTPPQTCPRQCRSKPAAPQPKPSTAELSPEASIEQALNVLFGIPVKVHTESAKQQTAGPSSKPEGSLKEQLESRSNVPAPSPSSGKGKAVAFAEEPQPTSATASLAIINDIEAEFKSLSSSFSFPPKLDISPPGSPSPNPSSTLSRLAFTATNAPVR